MKNQIDFDFIKYKKVKAFSRYYISEDAIIYDGLLNRCLKKYIASNGYQYVYLDKNNKQYTINVHILVATAWLSNLKNLPEVNHLDCNKLNNWAANLQWVSKRENMDHAVTNGRFKK